MAEALKLAGENEVMQATVKVGGPMKKSPRRARFFACVRAACGVVGPVVDVWKPASGVGVMTVT